MSTRTGLSQRERMPAALAPHYFDVDELSLPQLLVLALEYASVVRFTEAGQDGAEPSATSWYPYFCADETLVMADILATRLPDIRAEFDALPDTMPDGPANQGMCAQLPSYALYGLIKKLDGWSDVLLTKGSAIGIDLGALVAALRAQMAPELTKIKAFYDRQEPGIAYANLATLSTDIAITRDCVQGDDTHKLKFWFHQLLKGVEMTQRAAAQRLSASLESAQHDPGIGLLLAFVKLYQAAQQKLNRFTERHLDFYYDQVLLMRAKPAQRDSTFLVFQPAISGATIPVAGGTAFLAPFDKSQPELMFRSEHDIVVSDTVLVRSYTLFCERNPLNSPESGMREMRNGEPKQYPTACAMNDITVITPDASLNIGSLMTYPLFGAPRTQALTTPGVPARLGFALTSNVLLMSEGEREVRISLQLGAELQTDTQNTDTDNATLKQRLASASSQIELPLLTDQAMSSGENLDYKILRRMFNISVSGSTGWIPVVEYSAHLDSDQDDQLNISFILGAGIEPLVPYNVALHGEHFVTACPVLRFELGSEGYLYPYGLLRGLPFVGARIDVTVTGHRALALQNNIGQLSAAVPFQPFGPLPMPGSYLILGSAEAACKRLTSFDIVLEWGGLPNTVGGFPSYYRAYQKDGSAFEDVTASLSVLSDGAWLPSSGQQSITLFDRRDYSDKQRICALETVQFKPVLCYARALGRLTSSQPFVYIPGTKSGFFKVTLDKPEFVFGHRDYPFVLSDALTYNAQPGNIKSKRVLELPSPPYTPLINQVSLNYTATAIIELGPASNGDAFLRLFPHGWEMAHAASGSGNLLLPHIDYSGNLYLGFSASNLGAPLTLFFHLLEDALPMAEQEIRKIFWFYLVDNMWRPLSPLAFRADSTHAFLTSGIVTLTLPPDIQRDNSILPPDLYWLRISCESDLEKFCSLYSVQPHAAQVWRAPEIRTAAGAPAVIPAATIKRARHTIPGLGQITQMIASFSGRLPESRPHLRRRTAERLKHKGRAITADDYERLILEQFPQIDRVKCFPNLWMDSQFEGGFCPGHVLIVGLPPYLSHGHLTLWPQLNGYLIAQMHEFITARAAPAVTITIVNPVYQKIQVRCQVMLRQGIDEGACINLLDGLVSDFISPWSAMGNTSHFGWCIRQQDIESFILAQDGVLGVTQFSMLSVSGQSGDRFTLTDTAAALKPELIPDITPAYPWSIAVPNKHHAIEVAKGNQSVNASRTGIRKLEIGNTFIIPSGAINDDTQ